MARDYKPKRKTAGQPISGWIGVGCGLAAGLAIAAAIYVKDHRPDAPGIRWPPRSTRKRLASATRPTPTTPRRLSDDSGKSYAFYDMLPKFEVVVPEKDKDVRPDIRAVPETRSGTYVLQAGSYNNFADADRVRAKPRVAGRRVQGQKVSVDNDTGTGIRIGPISNLGELNRLRSVLRKADVDVLVSA